MPNLKPGFATLRSISWREIWLIPLCMMLAPLIYMLMIVAYGYVLSKFSVDGDEIVRLYFGFSAMAAAFFFAYLYLPSCLIALAIVIGLKALRLTQRWGYMAGGLLASVLPASIAAEMGINFLLPVFLTALICGWIYWRLAIDQTARRSRATIIWMLIALAPLLAFIVLL
jgi:hypothetical protein